MTTDLTYYERVACCILETATVLLEDTGLPVPARRAIVDTGPLGTPACCDALLVTRGKSRANLNGRDHCGPVDKIVDWEVRIFRGACQTEPACDDPNEPTCFDLDGWCPGDPWPDQPLDPCEPLGRAWARRLRSADRALLESQRFTTEIDACLCATELFGCETVCQMNCSTPTEWFETDHKTGGGCAGSIIKIRTHTIGA